MFDKFVITDLDAIKALSDPLRIRILSLFIAQPTTAKQMADLLGQPSAKIHYHVKELERNGLIRLVETREKGGILEKYYGAVAKSFEVQLVIHGHDQETEDQVKGCVHAAEDR